MKSRNKSHQVISNHIVSAQIGSLVVISCELMDEQSPFVDHNGCVMQFELTHTINAMKMQNEKLNGKNDEEIRCVSMNIHRSNKPIHALLISTQKLFLCRHNGERIMSTSELEKWFDSIGMTARKLTMRKWIEEKGCSIHLKRGKKCSLLFFWKMILFTVEILMNSATALHFFTFCRCQRWSCQYALHSIPLENVFFFSFIAIRRSQSFFSLSKRIATAFNCQLNLMGKNNSSLCERIVTEWFANFPGKKSF